jgi:glycosyltransferase 2 family protein
MSERPRGSAPDAALVAPNARHPGDLVRVITGLVVLAVTSLAVYRDRLSVLETNVFHLVNDLPAAIGPYLDVVMQAGNGAAGPVLAAVVLAIGGRRRWRPAFDLAVTGVLAWVAAKVVKSIIQRPRPGGLLDDVRRFGSDEGLGFVSGHAAVAAALAAAAAPYLVRSLRRAVWVVPWVVGIARIYFGAHLPLDILGGVALGWMIGAGLHYALGAPHGRPTSDDAAEVLRAAGWQPSDVVAVPGVHLGSFPFVASTRDGRAFVKLLDPDTRDRDLIIRAARLLAFRDVRDEASVSEAPAQANREAVFSLLARQHGVNVPIARAIVRHSRHVWLVFDHVQGVDLGSAGADMVSDTLLHELWRQVGALREAGIAHRDLVASNILIDDNGSPWFVDFAHAESFPRPYVFDNDVAELLVSTSLVVGPQRAVEAAVAVLGVGPIGRSLSELAPLALTPDARHRLRGSEHLRQLRETVVERTSAIPPQRSSHAPSTRRTVTATVLLLSVVAALIIAAGGADVAEALIAASPRWMGIAAVAISISALAGAASSVASIERQMAIGRAVAVRVATQGAGFAAGRRGEQATFIEQLARSGVPPAESVAAIATTRLAALAAWLAVMVVALIEAIDDEHQLERPSLLPALVVVAVVAALAQLTITIAAARDSDEPTGRSGVPSGRPALRFAGLPVVAARVVEVASGTFASIALVTAFGTDVPASHVAIVHLAGWAAIHLVPITPLTATRPAIVAIGLAVAAAEIPVAVAVAVVIALLDLARCALGLAALARATRSVARRPSRPVGTP